MAAFKYLIVKTARQNARKRSLARIPSLIFAIIGGGVLIVAGASG